MADSPHIVELNEENFIDVVVEGSVNQPVLVDFWADWCGPCKSLMPVLEKLAVEYNGAFTLAKLDTEAHPGIAQQLGIRSLPTVKLFKDKQLVDEFMGALPESDVRKFLDNHVVAAEPVEDVPAEENEDSVVTQAMALFEQGDADAARALLQEAQASDPTNADVLLALGQICVSTGDLDTASSCLSALPDDVKTGDAANRLSGTIEIAREADTSQSVAGLETALATDPNNSEIKYQLAIASALAGNMEKGLNTLLELVSKDPGFNDGAPRKKMLALFNVLGADPLVAQYRRKLATALN